MATLTTSYQQIAQKHIATLTSSEMATKYVYLRIYAKYSSQNINNNTSTVYYKSTLYVDGGGSYFYTNSGTTKTLSGSGATSTSAGANGTYYVGETTLCEISGTVTHNASGVASVSATAGWSSTPWGVSGSVTGTASLPTIPRASSITSAGNVTLGNACSIKWTPASTSFKYKIKFSLGSWSYTTGFISPNTTSAYTYTGYTIPNTSTLLSNLSSSTTGTMTAVLTTYNSAGTQIGSTSSKTFTVTVPSGDAPTVGTITLTPATVNGNSILIKGKNKLTVSVFGCKAGTGASITSYTFSGPGISTTTTSTSVSVGPVSSAGTLTYTVTVTDSRGRSTAKSASITCYDYYVPSFKSFDVYRVNAKGDADINGAYMKWVYELNYASVNSTNAPTVKIYGTPTGSGSAVTSGGTCTADKSATYNVYAVVTDSYGGSNNSSTIIVYGQSRILNITKDGTGVALGKMASKTQAFDCRWQIKTDDPINSLHNFSYRSTNPVTSPTDDTTAKWNNQGNLATTFYSATGKLNGQPSQYGFLLNITTGPGSQEAHHLWMEQSNGSLYHRGGNASALNGWRKVLDSSNYTSYAAKAPVQLYSNATGTTGTVPLSESAANFTYLEIFYTDNNGKQPDSAKIYSPNGKYVSLNSIEPSTNGNEPRLYIRSSGWTISGTSMAPGCTDLKDSSGNSHNQGVYGQLYPSLEGKSCNNITKNTYIKIVRVLGYK